MELGGMLWSEVIDGWTTRAEGEVVGRGRWGSFVVISERIRIVSSSSIIPISHSRLFLTESTFRRLPFDLFLLPHPPRRVRSSSLVDFLLLQLSNPTESDPSSRQH